MWCDCGAHPAVSQSEDIERRVQSAYARIAGDPNLTGALTDEAATILLRWAENEVRRIVVKATTPELLDSKVRQLRRGIRDMVDTAAGSSSPITKLQELIRAYPDPES